MGNLGPVVVIGLPHFASTDRFGDATLALRLGASPLQLDWSLMTHFRFAFMMLTVVAGVCAGLCAGCATSSGSSGSSLSADVAADTTVAGGASDGAGVDQTATDAAAAADASAVANSTGDDVQTADVAAPACVEKISSSSMYKLCLEGPTALKAGQTAAYVVTITGADALPATLAPSVKFIHIQMGHGGSKIPAIEREGDTNVWKITKIVPSMAGNWRLTVAVTPSDNANWDIAVK